MDWFDKIDKIERLSGKNVAEIARDIGFEPRYIYDLKSGKSKNPKSEFLQNLVSKVGVDAGWLLTGVGHPFGNEPGSNKVREYSIPLLSRNELSTYEPINGLETRAMTDDYPDEMTVSVPHWLRQYSTDLRAVTVFNDDLAPVLSQGDIAIFQASGYGGNGIHLYRDDVSNKLGFVIINGKTRYPVEIEGLTILGRVQAVMKRIINHPDLITQLIDQSMDYLGLGKRAERVTESAGGEGPLHEIINKLDARRQAKAEGYLEGLLQEQEAEHEEENVNSEEVG